MMIKGLKNNTCAKLIEKFKDSKIQRFQILLPLRFFHLKTIFSVQKPENKITNITDK